MFLYLILYLTFFVCYFVTISNCIIPRYQTVIDYFLWKNFNGQLSFKKTKAIFMHFFILLTKKYWKFESANKFNNVALIIIQYFRKSSHITTSVSRNYFNRILEVHRVKTNAYIILILMFLLHSISIFKL